MKLTNEQVLALLPHRPPFLLVDEVVDGEPGVRCVAVRTPPRRRLVVRRALPRQPGHARRAHRRGARPDGDHRRGERRRGRRGGGETLPAADAAPGGDKVGLFAGIDKVRFKRVCKPGDTLTLEAEIIAVHGPVGRAKVKATVDGQLACRGELMFAIVDAAAVAAGEAKL